MKSFATIFLLLLIVNFVAAQQIVIDSLKLELKTAKSDINRVDLLNELQKSYYLFKPDTAIMLGQEAYNLSEKLKYKKGEAVSLNRLASAYSTLGDYAKSLVLFTKALNISREANDSVGISRAYNNIGDTYLTQKDYTRALGYFIKAKGTSPRSIPDYPRVIYSLNIGDCYLRKKQFDSALLYLNATYDKVKKLQFNDLYGDFERDLGEVEAARGNAQAALAHFHRSVSSYIGVADQQHLSMVYYTMADFYQKTNEQDSAIFYAKKALVTAQEGSYNQGILDASKRLSDYYSGNNDKEAFRYLKLATAAKDSLFSQERVKQMLSISFEEKQRQQEIEVARKESRNQMKLLFLLGILSVFLLLAIVLYRNNRKQKEVNALLQHQKKEIESTLSELRVTQAQLIQSEKMASLGELTAGIAHEIQNPLNFVNNFSEVNTELIAEMKEEIAKGNIDEIKAIAEDIEENEQKINHHGKRADAIVKGMLQHSRNSTGQKEPTDINALADEYLRLSYHGLRAKDKSFNAAMETDFDETIGKINVNQQEVGRVILNVFTNAFYSVAEKKRLVGEGYEPTVCVTTRRSSSALAPGGLEIRVKDNGMGIPKKVLDKICQPFFTTKAAGQGTGLGLSLSYDIIKNHRGDLRVETKEGEYAEFIITLPLN